MAHSEDLIDAARESLEALAAHVDAMPTGAYRQPCDELSGASVGAHVRHCLDHFQALLRGLGAGRCDYDDRGRAVDVACDRACAASLARALGAELEAELRGRDLRRSMEVRVASSVVGEVAWQRSSVGRELQFVIGHAVHHAAMIAASCRRRGLPSAEAFGLAPSTRRYRADEGAGSSPQPPPPA